MYLLYIQELLFPLLLDRLWVNCQIGTAGIMPTVCKDCSVC